MWVYRGKRIESHDDLDPECTDIVYRIVFTDNTYYIGKKAVRAVRKCPPLKGKKRCRRLMKNLPFLKYQGSSEEAKARTPASKVILYQCSKRKAATYLEAMVLFKHDELFKDKCLNENIGGTFFRNSLDGVLHEQPNWRNYP